VSHTEQFITERRYLKNVSQKTIAWYQHSFKAFQGALDSRSSILGRVAALRERNVSAISVNTYLRCINAYLRWLHTEQAQPLLKIPRLKEEQKVLATFSDEHVKALIGFKPKGKNQARAHAACCLLLDTGVRISEALGIRHQDIDLDNMLIRVTGKGNKQRMVPISLGLRKLLFRWIQRCPKEFVFGTRGGTMLTVRNFQRDLKAVCVKIGITDVRCSPHTLRHTFAVSYLRAGGNLFYLSKILGHTSVRTTERYLQSLGISDIQAVHDRLSPLARRG
jgi:site-specific recombinase XerD